MNHARGCSAKPEDNWCFLPFDPTPADWREIVGPLQRVERAYGCRAARYLAVTAGRSREELLAAITNFESAYQQDPDAMVMLVALSN